MYYSSYSGTPVNTHNVQPTDWTPALTAPYATLPVIKEGSTDQPANLFAWKLFWVLGGYETEARTGRGVR